MKLFVECDTFESLNAFSVSEAVYKLCKAQRIDEKAVAKMILIQAESEGATNEGK